MLCVTVVVAAVAAAKIRSIRSISLATLSLRIDLGEDDSLALFLRGYFVLSLGVALASVSIAVLANAARL